MNKSSATDQEQSRLKVLPVLLLAGSFTFAFLLGEVVHELGHFLAHQIYGSPGVGVHLDPFGSSHISGVGALPVHVLSITSAAGPLLNLGLGWACSGWIWRRRRAALLPLLLWGPVALVQEGVTFSLGYLTPGGDARWIAAGGIPPLTIVTTGILCLLLGLFFVSRLLPLVGLASTTPLGIIYLEVAAGMGALMLVRAIHGFTVSPAAALENGIPLILTLLLSAGVTAMSPPRRKLSHTRPTSVDAITLPAVMPAILLGLAIFIVLLLTGTR